MSAAKTSTTATATTTITPPTVLLSEPLDSLSGHLNTVLINIGKLFKHQALPEQRVLGLQKSQAHDVISRSTRRFHDALDEIEIEILNARAVLERDVRAIKASQAERESAQLAATAYQEAGTPLQTEDVPMNDSAEDSTIRNKSPEHSQLEQTDEERPSTGPVDVLVESRESPGIEEHPEEEIKDIDLGDDLFGEGIADDFGPVDENSSFDLFNSTTGGDFDMDFPVESEAPAATMTTAGDLPALTATTAAAATTVENNNAAAENAIDNDLLLETFGDLNPTGTADTNDFDDLDFGTIDQTQTDVNLDDNPFGDHNNDEFDDFFNS